MRLRFHGAVVSALFSVCVLSHVSARAEDLSASKTFAERLGWQKGERILLVHVDDAGMSHDSNVGVEKAMEAGLATSFSVMMPTPWVPEIVHYLHDHPQFDAGVHLTLTSEWENYRWAPVAGAAAVPGLVDEQGDMWRSVEATATHASPEEVDKEIHAQLARAEQMGFHPTHIDSHMGTIFATPAYLDRYIHLGAESHLPIMFPGGHDYLLAEQYHDETIAAMKQNHTWKEDTVVPETPGIGRLRALSEQVWKQGMPVLDDLYNVSYDWTLPKGVAVTDANLREMKVRRYTEAFHRLKPGVTMVIVHCTDTSSTFPYISDSGPSRRGDLLAMLSPELREAVKREHLTLTTWRELQERRDKAGKEK